MSWAGGGARIDEMKNAYKILFGKSDGKRPRVRPRRTLEADITRI
jgi:hypothetical protein